MALSCKQTNTVNVSSVWPMCLISSLCFCFPTDLQRSFPVPTLQLNFIILLEGTGMMIIISAATEHQQ